MRTTVTLDADVAARLRTVMQERGITFKQALNDTLRAGLRPPSNRRRAYRLPTRRMGLRQSVDLDKALRLAGELEDEELVRKLELRK